MHESLFFRAFKLKYILTLLFHYIQYSQVLTTF
jgi:hypothetical protein